MLEKEVRRRKLSFGDVLNEKNIEKICNDTHLENLEDIYLSIGSLRFTAGYIINLVFEDKKDVIDVYLGKAIGSHVVPNRAMKGDVIVAGTDDILVTIAKCCRPVKGDDIVGYVTKGNGVQIHKKGCPNVQDTERLIDVEWNYDNKDGSYLTDIKVTVIKGKNQLLEIITKASQKEVFIESVNTFEDEDTTTFALTVKTTDINQLNNFISDLKSLSDVKEVERRIN